MCFNFVRCESSPPSTDAINSVELQDPPSDRQDIQEFQKRGVGSKIAVFFLAVIGTIVLAIQLPVIFVISGIILMIEWIAALLSSIF